MFGPESARSIEISAEYRRAEVEQWAANERLARAARGDRPRWLAARLARVLDIVRGRARIEGKLVETAASI